MLKYNYFINILLPISQEEEFHAKLAIDYIHHLSSAVIDLLITE